MQADLPSDAEDDNPYARISRALCGTYSSCSRAEASRGKNTHSTNKTEHASKLTHHAKSPFILLSSFILADTHAFIHSFIHSLFGRIADALWDNGDWRGYDDGNVPPAAPGDACRESDVEDDYDPTAVYSQVVPRERRSRTPPLPVREYVLRHYRFTGEGASMFVLAFAFAFAFVLVFVFVFVFVLVFVFVFVFVFVPACLSICVWSETKSLLSSSSLSFFLCAAHAAFCPHPASMLLACRSGSARE